jgi:hypothetical protein|tara:strand:+ start:138 stop:731 length:594 start_codon:yes stop_codon:yes gene_type:complete
MIKPSLNTSALKKMEQKIMKMVRKVVPAELDAVTVGIHEGAGNHQGEEHRKKRKQRKSGYIPDKLEHFRNSPRGRGAKNPKKGEPVTVAKIGALNHFGTETIPARPWLDVGVSRGRLKYKKIIETSVDKGENVNQAMKKVAVVAVGEVQRYITQLKEPPNAISTIEAKGSSNPLIDSGQMRQSVTSVMTRGDSSSGV